MATSSTAWTEKVWDRITNLNVFALVERLLTLAALVLVAVTVGGQLGDMLGLTGAAGTAVAWSIAVVYDALWIGALRMSELAIRQRSRLGMVVMLGLSVVAVGVSTATLYFLGHVAVFAGVPVAAAVFMGLRLFAANVLADAATARDIAKRSAADRNERALAHAEARHLASEAVTDVVTETAGHLAETRRQVARAETLTGAQVRIDKARAKAEKRLAKADKSHGEKAAAFMNRPLAVAVRPAITGATPRRDAPVPGGKALVKAGEDTGAASGETAAGTPVPAEGETPVPADNETDTYPDHIDGDLLRDIARVAKVAPPPVGEPMSNDQLVVALRYLRHADAPPASYRKALAAFRETGFVGAEERVRQAWGVLLSNEEVAPTRGQ